MRKRISRRLRGDELSETQTAGDGSAVNNPDNADESDRLIDGTRTVAERQPPASPLLPSFYDNSNLANAINDSPGGTGNNTLQVGRDEADENEENLDGQRQISEISPRRRNQATVSKLNDPQQDMAGQEKRMQQLQNSLWTSSWLCCPTITNIVKAGYILSEFHRRGRFEENHQGLNLSSLKHRYHLGVSIKSIQSYRNHIIGLVKPFVRVQIVDIDTGFHLKVPTYSPARPKHTRGLRIPDNPGALTWNQDLVFDIPYSGVVSERALYLFEIIDEQPSLSVRTNLNNQGLSIYRKVAWGYLIPVGVDGLLNVGLPALSGELGESPSTRVNTSGEFPRPSAEPNTARFAEARLVAGKDLNLRLQLYQYRHYDGIVGVMQRSALQWPNLTDPYKSKDEVTYPNGIPSIYLQWKLYRKMQVRGAFLKVAIGPRFAPSSNLAEPEEGSDAGSEHQPDDNEPKSSKSTGMLYKRRRRVKNKEDRYKMKSAALRRTRGPKDPCYVPDRFLYRLDTGPDGAMVVAFSNSGHLLAVASRAPHFNALLNTTEIVYSLLLYDTDLDEEVWAEEIAHHAVIYDIKWSKNDRYLLTCSADGTCKVFDLIALHPLMSLYPGYTASTAGGVDGISPRVGGDDAAPVGAETATAAGVARDASAMPSLRPNRIIRAYPPRVKSTLSLPASVYAYSGVFQEFGAGLSIASYFNPLGLSSVQNSALTVMGAGTLELAQWQEHMNALVQSTIPRVIVGAADGRIRVFDNDDFTGFIRVVEQQENGASDSNNAPADFSPHDGCVNALALDERTKYLISADSVGDVLVWRQDSQGWYQLLRKLRKDTLSTTATNATGNPPSAEKAGGATGNLRRSMDMSATLNNTTSNNSTVKKPQREQFNDGSILSLAIHPDKMKGMMLMMSRQPAVLKVLNLATYKPFHSCENFTGLSAYLVREGDGVFSTGVFYRSGFSADGKYILACCNVSQEVDRPVYKLLLWDSYTGQPINSFLSQLTFAYPVRSISWHPTQHLLAVAMLGPGAAVVLYTTDNSSVSSINQQQQHNQQQQQYNQGGNNMDVAGSTNSLPRMERTMLAASSMLPPSAFMNGSNPGSAMNTPYTGNNPMLNSGSRGNSTRMSTNAGANDKDMLAYSLLNSQSFVNLRNNNNSNTNSALNESGDFNSPSMMEMSRSNESLLPNMGTLLPNQLNINTNNNNKTASSAGLLSLNLATIAEGKTADPPATTAPTNSSAATPASEAETRINKMAKAREILARARAQRAAASAFADVNDNSKK